MPIKVLYIISDRSFGGGSRHLFDLITNLGKNFTPVLISIPSPILDLLKNRIKTYAVPMNSRWDLNAVKKMQDIIAREKPDIIHLHSTRAGILGTMAARRYKVKPKKLSIVYTEHLFTDEFIPQNKIIHFCQIAAFKYLAKYITQVIAVSGAVGKYFINKRIFPKNKIEVIYHGVNINKFYPTTKKNNNKQIIIGSIGTLTHIKGFEYLINAVQNIDNVKLEIIGVGPDLERLKKIDIHKKTKFLDYIDNPQKVANHWDVYVQPSLSEAFGLALAEAMAIGLPVIATKTGGMPELVGKKNILVPPEDTKSLSNAIIRLVSNKTLRQRLGKNNTLRIKKYFSLDHMVEKTEKLYEKIVKTRLKLK